MEDLVAKFSALKNKADAVKTEYVKAKTRYEASQEELQKLMGQMKEKYGVESIEDLKLLVDKKRAEVEEALNKLETILSQFE